MKSVGFPASLDPPKDAEWLKAKREEDEEDLPATFFSGQTFTLSNRRGEQW